MRVIVPCLAVLAWLSVVQPAQAKFIYASEALFSGRPGVADTSGLFKAEEMPTSPGLLTMFRGTDWDLPEQLLSVAPPMNSKAGAACDLPWLHETELDGAERDWPFTYIDPLRRWPTNRMDELVWPAPRWASRP